MVIQIAFGIFFGVLFLAVFAGMLIGLSYIISKGSEGIPRFIEEPKEKPRKRKSTIQDWWDRYDEGDDY